MYSKKKCVEIRKREKLISNVTALPFNYQAIPFWEIFFGAIGRFWNRRDGIYVFKEAKDISGVVMSTFAEVDR
jgi:hypothetical protein